MKTPILYRASQAVIRLATSIYFRKLEVTGRGNAPPSGPVLFAANHPQSGMDAIVLGVVAGRMVHYLAKSGLFRSPMKRRFFEACGVIPVYRAHEVADAADQNVAMFDACYRVLESGGAIGIFPEGTSSEERRLQKLKTGAARIALHGEARNDWKLGVVIVPVGINFQSRQRFRSRVLVSFGLPLVASDYRERFAEDEVDAVHELTSDIEEAIRRRTANISRADFTDFVDDVERVYKGELLARSDVPIAGKSKFEREQNFSQETARALDYFLDNDPAIVWRVRANLEQYTSRLEAFRLTDSQLRDEPPSVVGAATRYAVVSAIGLPVTAWGVVWNFIPYRLTGFLADRGTVNLTKVHLKRLYFGMPLYLVYYGALIYLSHRMLTTVPWVLFLATLAPTGFFARWHYRQMYRRRQALRLAFLRATKGIQVKQLQALRREVIREMDAALAKYMSRRNREN